MEWIECVRWCHWNEDQESVDALIELLTDLSLRSRYSTPILTKMQYEAGDCVGGYVVLYPGALASVGNLRSESRDNGDRDNGDRGNEFLVKSARELFQAAFDSGAEMVQAISPLIASQVSNNMESAFVSPDPHRDDVLRKAGMQPVAKLVQMECLGIPTVERPGIPSVGKGASELAFVSHHELSSNQWSQLVERTYVETRDVPELNGLRDIESTLEGYGSTIEGVPKTWWAVQCQGVNIGCLLLTPAATQWCEITYLGLVPEWRGQGLSKVVMNFVRDWAMERGIKGLTLAVDLRNTPAIRLYQSCGFVTQRFVQAWICFPK